MTAASNDKPGFREYLETNFQTLGREIGEIKRELESQRRSHADQAIAIGKQTVELEKITERAESAAANAHKAVQIAQGVVFRMDASEQRENRRDSTQLVQHGDNIKNFADLGGKYDRLDEKIEELKTAEATRASRHRSSDDDPPSSESVVKLGKDIPLTPRGVFLLVAIASAAVTALYWFNNALAHSAAAGAPLVK